MLDENKNKWQEEAEKQWRLNKGNGIVKSTTGSGKTKLALNIIDALIKYKPDALIIVIVNGIKMIEQWSSLHTQIKVYVVNSVALKNIVYDCDLAIFDECDCYMGNKWFTVYDKVKAKYNLLLTATLDTDKCKKLIDRYKIVYENNIDASIENNIVTDIKIYNLILDLTEVEKQQLRVWKEQGQKNLHFFESYQQAIDCINDRNLRYAIVNGTELSEIELLGKARSVQKIYAERQAFFYSHKLKIDTAVDIIKRFSNKKIMTFSTTIETANLISILSNSLLVHSELKKDTIKQVFDEFVNQEYGCLNSVKGYVRGLNIPSIDMIVIVTYNSSKTQFEQICGRAIRKFKGKKEGIVVTICLGDNPQSQDYVWLKQSQAGFSNKIGLKIKTIKSINEIL